MAAKTIKTQPGAAVQPTAAGFNAPPDPPANNPAEIDCGFYPFKAKAKFPPEVNCGFDATAAIRELNGRGKQ